MKSAFEGLPRDRDVALLLVSELAEQLGDLGIGNIIDAREVEIASSALDVNYVFESCRFDGGTIGRTDGRIETLEFLNDPVVVIVSRDKTLEFDAKRWVLNGVSREVNHEPFISGFVHLSKFQKTDVVKRVTHEVRLRGRGGH